MTVTKTPDLWKSLGAAIGAGAIAGAASLFGVATWQPDIIRPDPAKGSELDELAEELKQVSDEVTRLHLLHQFMKDNMSRHDTDAARQFTESREAIGDHQSFEHPPQRWQDRIRDLERFMDRHDHPDSTPRTP